MNEHENEVLDVVTHSTPFRDVGLYVTNQLNHSVPKEK